MFYRMFSLIGLEMTNKVPMTSFRQDFPLMHRLLDPVFPNFRKPCVKGLSVTTLRGMVLSDSKNGHRIPCYLLFLAEEPRPHRFFSELRQVFPKACTTSPYEFYLPR